MKNVIVTFMALFSLSMSAQKVLFDKKVYKINEDVKGTLLQNVIGISNGIKETEGNPQNMGQFNLKSANKPGYYRVDFYFTATEVETYFVLVLPDGVATNEFPTAIKKAKLEDIKYKKFLEATIKFSKDGKDFTPILNKAFASYIGKHPVDGPLTVVACVAIPVSGGNPIFIFTCKELAKDNTKDLVIAFLDATNEELKAKNYITTEEFNFYKTDIKTIDFLISYTTAGNLYEKMKAIAGLSDEETTKNLVLGADYTEQFVKKFQFVLKFK